MRNLHNLKQTKENENIVDDFLLSILIGTNANIGKDQLRNVMHISDRGLRRKIQEISLFYPVISLSSMAGYRVVNTRQLIEKEPQLIETNILHIKLQLAELNSRIKMLKKKMKPLIASLKVLEKFKNE